MEKRCRVCGKPFPAGQDWCNWCEPSGAAGAVSDVEPLPANESAPGSEPFAEASPPAELSGSGEGNTSLENAPGIVWRVFVYLLRCLFALFGVLLIGGGGLSMLCGVASSSSGDNVLVTIGLLVVIAGGLVIAAASYGARKPFSRPSDGAPE